MKSYDIVIIGGGLTGCEIAYDLFLKGKTPKIIEAKDDLIATRGVCLANSSYLRDFFETKNVEVHLESFVKSVEDGFVVIAVSKDEAEFYTRISPQIESKLRNSTRERNSVHLKNIDCNGKVMSASVRLAGRFYANNEESFMRLRNNLRLNQGLKPLWPNVVKYDEGNIYGVYVSNKSVEGDLWREHPAFSYVCGEIICSGMPYELTDAYGQCRPPVQVGDKEMKFCSDEMESLKMSQNKE